MTRSRHGYGENAATPKLSSPASTSITRSSPETLEIALQILGHDLRQAFESRTDTIRRLTNQALFEALWIADEEVVDDRAAEPLAAVRGLKAALDTAQARRGGVGGSGRPRATKEATTPTRTWR